MFRPKLESVFVYEIISMKVLFHILRVSLRNTISYLHSIEIRFLIFDIRAETSLPAAV